ncbi:MAG: hypothetical protein F6K28_52870 [Microcoleus sp. SIO2G3]|nr:hypothetical protein [Microcoleus sp. SIO2G3]
MPDSVRSIVPPSQGCYVLTETSLYLQPIAAAKLQLVRPIAPQTEVAIAPDDNWLVAVSPQVITIQTGANAVSLDRAAEEIACEVIALDSRHFAIASVSVAACQTHTNLN